MKFALSETPADEIAAYAKKEGLDLIVMGTAATGHLKQPSSDPQQLVSQLSAKHLCWLFRLNHSPLL